MIYDTVSDSMLFTGMSEQHIKEIIGQMYRQEVAKHPRNTHSPSQQAHIVCMHFISHHPLTTTIEKLL
jgi:hypothetical protein